MSHSILQRHLERQAVRPLYVFYGEEEFLMDRALARLEEGLRDEQGEPPVKGIFYAPAPRQRAGSVEDEGEEPPARAGRESQELALGDFLTESRTASLWGPGQLLVMRRLTLNAAVLETIKTYLDHPAPRTWVVLLAEGAKKGDLGKNPVGARLQKEEAALGFPRLKDEKLIQWVTQEAKTLGKSLTMAGAQRLVEIVGDNLADLSQELEKLALYAGAETTLTPNLVNQLSTHSRTYNIFALVEALGEASPHKRLTALANLLDLGEKEPKILVMLAKQLRFLILIKEDAAASLGPQFKLPQWKIGPLTQQAARFSKAALRSHLFLLHQIDQQLKTSVGSPRLWLEWALLKMGPG